MLGRTNSVGSGSIPDRTFVFVSRNLLNERGGGSRSPGASAERGRSSTDAKTLLMNEARETIYGTCMV